MTEESRNIYTETIPYKVFRHLSNKRRDHGSGIAESLGFAHGTITKHLSNLHNSGVLEKERDGRTVYYSIAWDNLDEIAEKSWRRVDVDLSIPEAIDLENYSKFYTSETHSSTIQKMFVDDFQLGLDIQDEVDGLPDKLKSLLEKLKDERGSNSPHRFVKYAIDKDEA